MVTTDSAEAIGVTLDAGHVILPGSMTASIPFGEGDVVTTTVAGLGSVTARMGVHA